MKRVVFFSVMTMMSAAGFAQRVLQTSTNTYLNEDKMVKQQISYLERNSKEKCHDMSDAEVLNKKYMVRYHVKNDSFPNRLTCIENGTQYQYDLRGDVTNETVRMKLAEEQMAKTQEQVDFNGSL